MSGMDCLYVPRVDVNKDDILGEDSLSKFTSSKEVEMYINTPEGFGGAGDIISKFGLDVQDEVILVVNKERFFDCTGMSLPREGDLVYLPLNKGLFEVKLVEHEKPFYTLGKNTVFELTCESFQYSNNIFDIPASESGAIFDKIERENATSILLTMGTNTGYTVSEVVYQGSSLANATATAKVATQVGDSISLKRESPTKTTTTTNTINTTPTTTNTKKSNTKKKKQQKA